MDRLSAMKTHCQFRLLDLPNELIFLCCEQVDTIKALRRLSRSCRRVQQIAEQVLYRTIAFRTGLEAQRVLRALNARPERCAGIQHLDIACLQTYEQDFQAIYGLVTRAKNLRELYLESPECNGLEFEDNEKWQEMAERIFQPFRAATDLQNEAELARAPLQRLTNLTLHLNGAYSPYWTLDEESLPIMWHPTLQYLKLSCVNIVDIDPDDHYHHRVSSTPLKHLELEECNISHEGLLAILSYPQALEKLYLGENCYNINQFPNDIDPSANHLFQTDPEACVKALSQQKHSLRELEYVTTEAYYQHRHLEVRRNPNKAPVNGGFADFHALEKVTLVGESPDFERAMMTSRSPPNLKTIKFTAPMPFHRDIGNKPSDESQLALVPFLRAPSCSNPEALKHISVLYDGMLIGGTFKLSDATQDFIKDAAKAAEKMGVLLTISYRTRNSYYPPFLYGEPRPREVLVFGGVKEGFIEEPDKGYMRRGRVIVIDEPEYEEGGGGSYLHMP